MQFPPGQQFGLGVDVGADLPDAATVAACVSALDPATGLALTDAATFRRSRRSMEAQEIARLTKQLPLEQVVLPAKLVAGLTPSDIDDLAGVLGPDGDDPT